MTDSKEKQCYLCLLCGYIYDPEIGDPYADVPEGTPFDSLDDDWVCPMCYVGKEEFEPVD